MKKNIIKKIFSLLLLNTLLSYAQGSVLTESPSILKGDFNGDGVTDVLIRNKEDGNLYTMLVSGDGTSSTLNKIVSGIPSSEWELIKTAKFNSDNQTDILIQRKSDGNLYTVLLGADGTSATLNKIISGIPSSEWDVLHSNDFNGDGVSDILIQRKSDGNLYTVLVSSDGTTSTLNKIVSGMPNSEWDILQTGDFNGDDVTDILAQRKSDGNLYTILVGSDGTTATLNKIVSGMPSSEWDILDTNKFNSDASTDILAQRKSDGNIYTILLNASGTSATLNKIVSGMPSSEWNLLQTGNFNSDSITDILVQRKSDGNIYTILVSSDGTSSSLNKVANALLPNEWDILNQGDLNGDGIDDMLVQRKSDGNLYTLLMNSDGTSASLNKIVSGIPSSEWTILDASDYNGDGIVDVLVQRKSDGNIYTVLLNSDASASSLNGIASGLLLTNWELSTNTTDLFENAFITIWKTDNSGATDDNQIKITTWSSGYNYSIDWGDSTIEHNVTSDITHTYADNGVYTVKIAGKFPQFRAGNDSLKLLSVEQWGDIQWTSMYKTFYGCKNMVLNATDTPDLSNVTNMAYMFRQAFQFNQYIGNWDMSNVENISGMFMSAWRFNQDISEWDTSHVKYMRELFRAAASFNQPIGNWDVSHVSSSMFALFCGASDFNQDISSWDVSHVYSMYSMFRLASSFNQDIGGWDVSNVQNMGQMFSGASAFNQNIGNWDVSNVYGMRLMFDEASSFNQNISSWDVSKVDDMQWMFAKATNFNQPIGIWNVSKVRNMSSMFSEASSFNQPIGNWDVSKVTSMSSMFYQALVFNQPIGNWDVSNVTSMYGMFRGKYDYWGSDDGVLAFNQDISLWNTSKVTSMGNMFSGASSFDQNIGSWDVSSVTSMYKMFNRGAVLSVVNYDALLNGWSEQALQSDVTFTADNNKYSADAAASRQTIIDAHNWSITDGGQN